MNARFLRSLYEEHLEELSMLYERRRGFLDDPEIELDDLLDLEGRMEAHLDALVVGGERALELCAERVQGDDVGEVFGALCLFGRQGRQDLVEAAIERFDTEDEDEPDEDEPDEDDEGDEPTLGDALADALRLEGALGWKPLYERVLAGSQPTVRAAVALMAGARRVPLGPKIVAALSQGGDQLGPLLWSVGRLRERSGTALLAHWAQRPDTEEGMVATLGMLRFGDPSIIDHVVRLVPSVPWAISLVAITGGVAHGPLIASRLQREEVGADDIVAAGLFGDAAVVPRLLELLAAGTHPEASTQALFLLTGAPVFETVVEEVEEIEEPAEGEEAEGEAEAPEPDPRDQQEIVRLSQDPEAWRAWWDEHQSVFVRGKRFRLGQLASPAVLGATLHRFVLRRSVRQLAAEEIGLRYWPKVDLDVDMLGPAQISALAGLGPLRQSDAVIARADGAWVFARALSR